MHACTHTHTHAHTHTHTHTHTHAHTHTSLSMQDVVMTEQVCALVVEVKEIYKRQICWRNSSLYQQLSLLVPQPLSLTAIMKNIIIFFVFTAISLGVTKRHKPVLPARIPATSVEWSDTACPSNSIIVEDVCKTNAMLDRETLFRPCDCGGPGWEKIALSSPNKNVHTTSLVIMDNITMCHVEALMNTMHVLIAILHLYHYQ